MSKELIERLRVFAGDPALGGVIEEAADRIEELERERDQLRKDVTMLNKLVIEAKQAFDGVNVDSRWFDRGMAILDEALAATEPKA